MRNTSATRRLSALLLVVVGLGGFVASAGNAPIRGARRLPEATYTLLAEKSECRGREMRKTGLTIAECAGACIDVSQYFIYGRKGSSVCKSATQCRCFCELVIPKKGDDKLCVRKSDSRYNLYTTGAGLPDVVEPIKKEPVKDTGTADTGADDGTPSLTPWLDVSKKVGEKMECTGKEAKQGTGMTKEQCAAKCAGKSDYWIIGRKGSTRDGHCYCELATKWKGGKKAGEKACGKGKSSNYDLYTFDIDTEADATTTMVKDDATSAVDLAKKDAELLEKNNKIKDLEAKITEITTELNTLKASASGDSSELLEKIAAKDVQLAAMNTKVKNHEAFYKKIEDALKDFE